MLLTDKRVFITGGTGSLAKATLARAKREQWNTEFVIFSRDETKQTILKEKYPEHQFVLGDVSRYLDLKRALRDVDVVLHFAAYKQIPSAQNNISATIQTNILGSQNVVDAAIDMGVKQVVASSTDKACLDWHSKVLLSDGTTADIARLVKDRYSGEVKSIDPTSGTLVSKRVIGWYKNSLANRRMFKVSYERSSHHRGQFTGVVVTEDHPILTTGGWKQAKELSNLDFLVTNENTPNRKQMELIIGTMLGDAALSKPYKSGRSTLRFGHAEDQKEWFDIVVGALENITGNAVYRHESKGTKQPFYQCESKSGAFWGELYSYFYNGKKIVPYDLIETYFSPVLMAAWFMDDGCISVNNKGKTSPNARLATHGFSREDVFWLEEFLTHKGFECKEYKVTLYGKTYYELRFSVEGTKKLIEYILPAVPSSMSKKTNGLSNYDNSFWNMGEPERYTARAVIEEIKAPKRDVYCIDVEDTHTFIVNGVVVHNCQPENFYGVSKKAMEYIFQDANKYGATTFHLARYGNVLMSNQSVGPLWQQQVKQGKPITLTDDRMTRFFLTLDQAIDLILLALALEPGVIVVPKAPAMRMIDLAKVIGGNSPIKVTKIRSGEKLSEGMVSEAESFYTSHDDNYFYIHPPTSEFRNTEAPFNYMSDNPVRFLTNEEIAKMIADTERLYGAWVQTY